jgi:CelD/BcsL family acetyltransferase involved in cellulose biosynthesis
MTSLTLLPPRAAEEHELRRDVTGLAVTTRIVTEVEEFIGLEHEWNEAVARAGVPHPFLRHEWCRTWWESFSGTRRLHIVVARRGGVIVGIAPLMTEQVHMYGLPIRKLDLLHNDHTPRTDWIVAGARPQAVAAIWDALRATRDEWDLLQLSRLPDDSPTGGAVAELARRDGCQIGTWRGDVSPYLALTGTWDSYHASLSAKFRSNLRNRFTRLSRFGEARLEVVDEITDAARDDAWRLEASGWKAASQTSIASDPAVRQFYTQLADRAAERGWLRLLFLTVGGRRIATSYGACFDRRLFLFKTGYDPAYASCSPFKLLTGCAIRSAYAEGLREVDFLGDAEPWKLEWTSTSRAHDWLFVFSGTRRARLLHSLKFQVAPELKRWRA